MDDIPAELTPGQPRRLTVKVIDAGQLAFLLADSADERDIEALIRAAVIEIQTGAPVVGELDG